MELVPSQPESSEIIIWLKSTVTEHSQRRLYISNCFSLKSFCQGFPILILLSIGLSFAILPTELQGAILVCTTCVGCNVKMIRCHSWVELLFTHFRTPTECSYLFCADVATVTLPLRLDYSNKLYCGLSKPPQTTISLHCWKQMSVGTKDTWLYGLHCLPAWAWTESNILILTIKYSEMAWVPGIILPWGMLIY